MEPSRKTCRICLSDSELNLSITSNYCRKTNLLEKTFVCLRLRIEETDYGSICYECATNVENFYGFINRIKRSQAKIPPKNTQNKRDDSSSLGGNRRLYSSYLREQVIDADYSFSFLEVPDEPKKHTKTSSPFFSYFTPSKDSLKAIYDSRKSQNKAEDTQRRAQYKKGGRLRNCSRDVFDSESQDVEEHCSKGFDWKLTPDDDIIKRVKDNFFGKLDFN